MIQRCTSDVDTIRIFLSTQFVEIGRALFMVSSAVYIMLSLNVKMTFIAMSILPIIFCFAVIFFIKVKEAFKLSDESEGRLSSNLQENLTGVRVVRAFARQEFEIEKFDIKNKEFKDLTYRLILLLASYWSLSDLLCMLQVALVLFVGTLWAVEGIITLGTLVVFTTYEGMLLWPIRQMGRILTDMGKTIVSLKRIQEILDEKKENYEEGLKPQISGEIEFKNVIFAYEKDKRILDGVSFKVKKGQTVAILGPTGSGKSTLMHLIPRLYDYSEGSITIDGTELKDINKEWIRKNVGIVLQEPFLYSKTIKENIKIAADEKEDSIIFDAASTASIHDVIEGFEKGYDTIVGERGVTLSGGQKQRVAIARTVLLDTPILIFDDSLSAVDTETDRAIREALNIRDKRSTTFIISHRINTLSQADFIIVLEEGKIVQSGTHEELIQIEGLYNRIWKLQNSIDEELESEEENEKGMIA